MRRDGVSMIFRSFLFILYARSLLAFETSFTYRLEAGREECFFQDVPKDSTTEIEYQVIEGGDMDIDFSLYGVNGHVIRTDRRQADGMHTVNSDKEGLVQFCFGNTFSRVTEKIVFIDIGVNRDDDDSWTTFDQIDDSVDSDFKPVADSVHRVTNDMEKVQRDQDHIRGREARDRHIVESNLFRIPMWSIVNCLVLILTTGLQVYFVRRLFIDDRGIKT
ncbi:transmembrane emp24 domain-containing protein 5-like [Corticium candelabrum]|uniref:transmembrane emp24 domain-containing protein 5-like n=1 Tax=Corticium candelabrum TaxID=121492 RepID=UPI002E2528D8|nr:transmembrane emp24 domain-containing protein 5-like [Corticium candelabrum]